MKKQRTDCQEDTFSRHDSAPGNSKKRTGASKRGHFGVRKQTVGWHANWELWRGMEQMADRWRRKGRGRDGGRKGKDPG